MMQYTTNIYNNYKYFENNYKKKVNAVNIVFGVTGDTFLVVSSILEASSANTQRYMLF